MTNERLLDDYQAVCMLLDHWYHNFSDDTKRILDLQSERARLHDAILERMNGDIKICVEVKC